MPLRNKALITALSLIALLAGSLAHARNSDRKQPMDIASGYYLCDSGKTTTCTFSKRVIVTQGTLKIDSEAAVIVQTGDKPNSAKFTGGVTLHQEMDDGTPLNAKANALDYDMRTETIVLTGNVTIQQDRGTLSGERVTYHLKTGQIESGSSSGGGRVKMRIVPKDTPGAP